MSMKSLLTAIKSDLQGAAGLSYIDDASIFITPDENMVPVSTVFPAIGLKDGQITMEKAATNPSTTLTWEIRYYVHVIIYVDMTAGETPVMGQTLPAIYGILDINDAVRTVLHEDYQSITGILDAYCVEESESETIGGNDMLLQKKRMTFEYFAVETM